MKNTMTTKKNTTPKAVFAAMAAVMSIAAAAVLIGTASSDKIGSAPKTGESGYQYSSIQPNEN